ESRCRRKPHPELCEPACHPLQRRVRLSTLRITAAYIAVRANEQHLRDAWVGIPQRRLEIFPLFVDCDRMQPVSNRRAGLQVTKLENINADQFRIVSRNAE